MEIRVLGPVEVVAESQPVKLGGPKQRAVLSLLVARAGERLSGDFLLNEVYGDEAALGSRRSIQTYVSNLRRVMGEMIDTDRRGYLLRAPVGAIDAVCFERLHTEGAKLIEEDPIGASDILRKALSLWRGHAYADVEARGALTAETARLSQMRLDVLELRIEADLAAGRHGELIGELEALTLEHPFRERFRAQHMMALYRAGRQGDALRAFTKTRKVLVEELGVEPSPELQTLELQILDQDPHLSISVTSTIERMAVLAAEHDAPSASQSDRDTAAAWRDQVFTERVRAHGGEVVDVRRNTVYARFPTVAHALEAAAGLPARSFRMAVDFGSADVTDGSVSGPSVTRALRLAAVAHPGQVVVTEDAQRSLTETGARGWTIQLLGRFDIRGIGDRIHLFQLAGPDRPDYPALQIDRLPPPLGERGTASGIAGYELREILGEGTTGLVHRAYQASVGREVAVRVVPAHLVVDSRFIRRFESEMQRILDLSHPSIIPVIDFWREPSAAYVVSRLAPLATLTDLSGLGDPDRALDVVGQVAEAVAYAHDSGIVHGRIRPHNIAFDHAGIPALTDPGLPSLFHGLVQYPADAYTAPESIHGPPSPATDIYALGVLAAEVLSGREIPPDGVIPKTDPHLDGPIERATRPDPTERYPDVASFLADLRGGGRIGAGGGRSAVRNPYKGLAAFREVDAGDFYGRERLVDELVGAVETSRFTVVVGSSGIGKSSVVLAGVAPRLGADSDRPLLATMTPGDDPFESLTEALQRVSVVEPGRRVAELAALRASLAETVSAVIPTGTELVLVVDQFEELFVLASGQDRTGFLGMLAENATDPASVVRVIATMRADFYDRPLDHPGLGALVASNTVAVHAPTREEWRDIVVSPAENQGVAVDSTLVEAIIEDAKSEPGALPLVQHALTQMFADRNEDRLTLEAYRRSGGLAGWIGRTAERLYHGLTEPDRQLVREVFVRLVAVGEESEDTRRRVRRSELERVGLPWPPVRSVLEGFVANRLVVAGRDPATREPTVEVAHEALIHRWDRLASWIDEMREDLLVARRIELAARDWAGADRADEYLYRGGRLDRAEEWLSAHAGLVTVLETEFLTESRRHADRLAERAWRTRRRVIAGLSSALVISLALAASAWLQRGVAERRAAESDVHRLTTEARLAIDKNPELAVLLALEAHGRADGLGAELKGEAVSALQATTQGSRLVGFIPGVGIPEASPEGRLLVAADNGTNDVVVFDQVTLEEVGRFDPGMKYVKGAFSPDGSKFAMTSVGPDDSWSREGTGDFAIKLFDTPDFGEVAVLGDGCCATRPFFSPDGSWLGATDLDGGFVGWRVANGDERRWPGEWERTIRWTADSSALLQVSGGSELIRRDTLSGEVSTVQTLPTSGIGWMDSHPSGKAVVIVGANGAEYWEFGDVQPRWTTTEPGLAEAEFSPDGSLVAMNGNNSKVFVRTADGGSTIVLGGHLGGARNVSFGSSGDTLFVEDDTGIKVWDVSPGGRPALGRIAVPGVRHAQPLWSSADASRVVVRESYETHAQIAVYRVTDGRKLGQSSEFDNTGWRPVASHSGAYAGGVTPGGAGVIERLGSREEVFRDDCLAPLAISDDGEYAALMDTCRLEEDTFVVLVDLDTGLRIAEWVGQTPAYGPAGTPSEGLVAYIRPTGDRNLVIRSLPSGAVVDEMDTMEYQPPWVTRFSSDGRYLAFGRGLGGGIVIDVERFRGGAPLADSVILETLDDDAPSPYVGVGGGMAAMARSGELITLWDLGAGARWATIPIETGGFGTPTVTADGRYVYYEATDGVVARMPLRLEQLVELARSSVFRDFTGTECETYDIADDCSTYEESVTESEETASPT